MSRLLQSLERLQKGEAAEPLGFGLARAARRERPPAMLVVAAAAKPDRAAATAKLVDAFLLQPAGHVPSASALKKLADALGETPWGLQTEQLSAEQNSSLKEHGCDFLALSSTSVPLDALKSDDLGRVFILPQNLDEEQKRALEVMPVDAVVAAQAVTPPLDLKALLDLAALRGMINKPFFLHLAGVPSTWELECLRDIGVDGVVLSVETVGADGFQTLRNALREVPARRPNRQERVTALLPQVSGGLAGPGRQLPPPLPDEDDD